MDPTPEVIRLSNSRTREETGAGAGAMSRGGSSEACLILLARESVKGKGEHTSKRKGMCRDRWEDGRTISWWFYILRSLPLVTVRTRINEPCAR